MFKYPACLVALWLATSHHENAFANPLEAVACPHTDGLIDGPHVSDEATARAIALVIISRMDNPERQQTYDLNIQDGGDHWVVWQSVRGDPRRDATVIRRGNGLSMRIAKCDGALSSVHWMR